MERVQLAYLENTETINMTNGVVNLVAYMKVMRLELEQVNRFMDAAILMIADGIGVIGKIAIGIMEL